MGRYYSINNMYCPPHVSTKNNEKVIKRLFKLGKFLRQCPKGPLVILSGVETVLFNPDIRAVTALLIIWFNAVDPLSRLQSGQLRST